MSLVKKRITKPENHKIILIDGNSFAISKELLDILQLPPQFNPAR